MIAKHYGFTDPPSPRLWRASEELAFIIGYDTRLRRSGFGGQVKYRLGRNGGED